MGDLFLWALAALGAVVVFLAALVVFSVLLDIRRDKRRMAARPESVAQMADPTDNYDGRAHTGRRPK